MNSSILFQQYPACLLPTGLGLLNTLIASLQRSKTSPNQYSEDGIKQSDNDSPVIMDHWGMRSITSSPLSTGPVKLGVASPDRVISIGRIQLFYSMQTYDMLN